MACERLVSQGGGYYFILTRQPLLAASTVLYNMQQSPSLASIASKPRPWSRDLTACTANIAAKLENSVQAKMRIYIRDPTVQVPKGNFPVRRIRIAEKLDCNFKKAFWFQVRRFLLSKQKLSQCNLVTVSINSFVSTVWG